MAIVGGFIPPCWDGLVPIPGGLGGRNEAGGPAGVDLGGKGWGNTNIIQAHIKYIHVHVLYSTG